MGEVNGKNWKDDLVARRENFKDECCNHAETEGTRLAEGVAAHEEPGNGDIGGGWKPGGKRDQGAREEAGCGTR